MWHEIGESIGGLQQQEIIKFLVFSVFISIVRLFASNFDIDELFLISYFNF